MLIDKIREDAARYEFLELLVWEVRKSEMGRLTVEDYLAREIVVVGVGLTRLLRQLAIHSES